MLPGGTHVRHTIDRKMRGTSFRYRRASFFELRRWGLHTLSVNCAELRRIKVLTFSSEHMEESTEGEVNVPEWVQLEYKVILPNRNLYDMFQLNIRSNSICGH